MSRWIEKISLIALLCASCGELPETSSHQTVVPNESPPVGNNPPANPPSSAAPSIGATATSVSSGPSPSTNVGGNTVAPYDEAQAPSAVEAIGSGSASIPLPMGMPEVEPEASPIVEPETPTMTEPETPTMAEPETPTMAEPETPTMAEPETPTMAEPETPTMAEPEPEQFPPAQPFEPKILTGETKLAILNRNGDILWQLDIRGISDAWLLPSGNVCVAYKTGVKEVTAEKETVWEISAASNGEHHTCQPLENGGFLVAEAIDGGDLSAIYELNSEGEVQRTVSLTGITTDTARGQFRQVRKTPQGTYLLGYRGLQATIEVDDAGNVLREFPGGRFAAVRLPNGNTLVSRGDNSPKLIEVSPEGEVVWSLTRDSIPEYPIFNVAGFQRLSNGNTVITNWGRHAGNLTQPQLLEITPDKQVVWSYNQLRVTGTVTTVHVIDSAQDLGFGALR